MASCNRSHHCPSPDNGNMTFSISGTHATKYEKSISEQHPAVIKDAYRFTFKQNSLCFFPLIKTSTASSRFYTALIHSNTDLSGPSCFFPPPKLQGGYQPLKERFLFDHLNSITK